MFLQQVKIQIRNIILKGFKTMGGSNYKQCAH